MSLALWTMKKRPEVLNFIVLVKPKRCLSPENLIGETYHHICFEECRCVFRLIERFMSFLESILKYYIGPIFMNITPTFYLYSRPAIPNSYLQSIN